MRAMVDGPVALTAKKSKFLQSKMCSDSAFYNPLWMNILVLRLKVASDQAVDSVGMPQTLCDLLLVPNVPFLAHKPSDSCMTRDANTFLPAE